MSNNKQVAKSYINKLRDQFKSQVDSMFNTFTDNTTWNVIDAFDSEYDPMGFHSHQMDLKKRFEGGSLEHNDEEIYDNKLGIFGDAKFPPTDIITVRDTESNSAFIELHMVIAPMKKENLSLSVKSNGGPLGSTFPNYKTLVVRGDSSWKKSTDHREVAGIKRSSWISEKVFDTDKYDMDQISANVEDGVLIVKIPIKDQNKSKKKDKPTETPISIE